MQPTTALPTTGTPSPAAPPVMVDSLGLPIPPPGSTTSDRGHRLARPTPIGQLAPEEPPPETPGAPVPPATTTPPAR